MNMYHRRLAKLQELPYGRKGCFAKGSLVSTPKGEIPIEELKEGDEVIVYDDQGELHVGKITETHFHENLPVWEYVFWGQVKLQATENHFVLNQYGNFAAIGTLTEKDFCINYNNHVVPLLSSRQIETQDVYNLEVSPWHTMIVNGIRVHNGGIGHDLRALEGAKGKKKGGGGRPAKEAPNTLQSRSTVRLIDALSEGEIVGLVNGEESIIIDETPYKNPDGTYNFNRLTWDFRPGTPDQDYLSGFPDVESEVSVGISVKNGSPVTRTLTNLNATSVRVSIQVDQLLQQDKKTGDVNPFQIQWTIEIRPNGGSFVTYVNNLTKGKTTSAWQKSFVIHLPGTGPWDIRVSKVSPEPADLSQTNDMSWLSYTEILDYKLAYPDTALIGITVDAEQFEGRIPARGYEVYGIICKVPTNYDPINKTYDGIWDGTFKRAWTDCPPWILYDILSTPRYWGEESEIFGSVITEDQIDKWSFYDAAQWCDGLVPDGKGGMEARFTFNACINQREEAFTVIQALCSSFNAMPYWARGKLYISVDKPSDPVRIISQADTINGVINYQGTALKSRHTSAKIAWNNPDEFYHADYIPYEDATRIRKYGNNQADLVAFGCTRRSQALRYGRWILETEWSQTQTAVFQVSFDNADVLPGELIYIADRKVMGFRGAGHLVSCEETSAVLDSEISLVEGHTYKLIMRMPDGTLDYRQILNPPGNTKNPYWEEPLTQVPESFAMWVVSSTLVEPRQFRVIGVTEKDKHIFEVTALFHDPTKYDRIEKNLKIDPPNYTALPQGPIGIASNMTINERLYTTGTYVKSAALISWTPPNDPRIVLWEMQVKEPGGEFIPYEDTSQTSVDVLDTRAGYYGFRVRGITSTGTLGPWLTRDNVQIQSLLSPPSDVTNFRINVLGDFTYLAWDKVLDLDLSHYVLRFSPADGPTWASSTIIVESIGKDTTQVSLPTQNGSFLIKAVDLSGVESVTAAIVSTNLTGLNNLNIIELIEEDPAWAGNKTDVLVTGFNELYLDVAAGVTSGTYESAGYVDTGAVFTSRISPSVVCQGIDMSNDVADWLDISEVSDWSSSESAGFNVQLELALSQEAHPNGYGDWMPLIVGDYTFQSVKFRAKLFSYASNITPLVTHLSFRVDMPDRTDGKNNIVSGAAPYTVVYDPPFKAPPAVAFSMQNLQSGDRYEKSDMDENGFTITFYDASNTIVSRTFDWVAKGYGYKAD